VAWLPSLITLLVFGLGILVYRWQKTVDRETELLTERRRKYDDYILSRHRAYAAFSRNPKTAAAGELIEYFACRDKLMIQVPESVMEALGAHAIAFERLRQSMLSINAGLEAKTEAEFRQIVEDEADSLYILLGSLRQDLGSHSRFLVRLPNFTVQDPSLGK
jgi:hypothetical protein